MTARPLISVFNGESGEVEEQIALPGIFSCPVRHDVVNFVHYNMAKNKRQPYAVSKMAGHQTSAESWGTGRAVARIPRVSGGGTHRAGQGAFGNMCRGGRMFAPTKTWRKWHRKINTNQKRYALCSAIAASAVPSLVMARGHRVSEVSEVPLVVSTGSISSISKTSKAVSLLKTVGAFEDVQKVKDSKNIRAGKGKMRNRRHTQKKGPLVIYNEKGTLINAFRNIPGIELCNVNRLNLLQLAPGGHLGRFVVWTKDAFQKLDAIYGTPSKASQEKVAYRPPRSKVSHADISRIINSDEIQSVVRPKKYQVRAYRQKRNPLKNYGIQVKLNPYAKVLRKQALLAQSKSARQSEVSKRRSKRGSNEKFVASLLSA